LKRDEELKRLVKYAQAMNVRVSFKPQHNVDADADWTTDGKEINIYDSSKKSKVFLILCLIHEIGHHCQFIHGNDRKVDAKLDEALASEEEKKSYRKRIYDWEVKGTGWWESIYKDADLKFPIYKLYIERDSDLWMYQTYYETGKFPTKKDKREKRKELKRKYRP